VHDLILEYADDEKHLHSGCRIHCY